MKESLALILITNNISLNYCFNNRSIVTREMTASCIFIAMIKCEIPIVYVAIVRRNDDLDN